MAAFLTDIKIWGALLIYSQTYHLSVLAFSFQVVGIAILALGIWTKVDLYKYMELSSIYYKESPYVLIGLGVVIVIVGSLGCCCTIKGNTILLYLVRLIFNSIAFLLISNITN